MTRSAPTTQPRLALACALTVLSAVSPGCGGSGAGPTGPAGPTYTAGAGLSISGTTISVAAGGISGAMLATSYAPASGAPAYLWNSPASPQVGSLDLTGGASFGGAVMAGGLATANVEASGTVSAARFSGDGSALTALPAASLTGTLSDAQLSSSVPLLTAGRLPQSMLPSTVALAASVPALAGDNTFTGATTFGGAVGFASLVAPPSAGPPAGGPQGAAAAGRLFFDTVSGSLQVHDGTGWRILAVATSFGQRTTTASVAAGGAISVSGFGTSAYPTVTVWAMVPPATVWTDVSGTAAYPTSFFGGTVTVTNGTGLTHEIAVSAVGR